MNVQVASVARHLNTKKNHPLSHVVGKGAGGWGRLFKLSRRNTIEITRAYSSTGERRQQHHRIAILNLGIETLQEANVLVIQKNVNVRLDLSFPVKEAR